MKLLVVDDHRMVRAGLRALLADHIDGQVLEAANGSEALTCLRRHNPDLVLLDLVLPDICGLSLLRQVLSACPTARVVVLSMHAEPWLVAHAMEIGAVGYLSKAVSAEELMAAADRALAGTRYIEREIAQKMALRPSGSVAALNALEKRAVHLLAQGKTKAEISDALHISYRHAVRLCGDARLKLGASSVSDLLRFVILTDPDASMLQHARTSGSAHRRSVAHHRNARARDSGR
jgi:two-component system, NarL family, invasion response regulator UvrY